MPSPHHSSQTQLCEPTETQPAKECAEKLRAALRVTEQYVHEKMKLVSRLTESLLPIPPKLCFFADDGKQEKHLRRMLKHGWDVNNFYFIDINATDSEDGSDVQEVLEEVRNDSEQLHGQGQTENSVLEEVRKDSEPLHSQTGTHHRGYYRTDNLLFSVKESNCGKLW